ncbi:MAG: hypothetical protein Q9226_006166 [Calogaya cf. arnoldii]
MTHSADLERYIIEKLRNSDMYDDINMALQEDIVKKSVQGAQEMFLLAVLHVQPILNEPTLGNMEDALDRLPQGLQTAFEETIQRIKRQSETCSNIALQALRPPLISGSHVLAADSLTIDEYALDFLRARPQLTCSYQIWQYVKGRREEYWTAEEAVSCNPLHMAAMFGLHDIAAKLLAEYAIDETTRMGTIALMKAACCGHRSLVSLFMDENADPEKHNWYGTVLHTAAEAGQVNCIHELLDRGVDVDIKDDHGRAPLICAVQSGNTRAIRVLLDRGAGVNLFYRDKGTPLFVAVQEAATTEVIQTLLEYGADINAQSDDESTALSTAVHFCNADALEIPLGNGADPEIPDDLDMTPLAYAEYYQYETLVQILLEAGAKKAPDRDDEITEDLFNLRRALKQCEDGEGVAPGFYSEAHRFKTALSSRKE